MVNLRNRRDGGFASATGHPLLDGDSRRQSADQINIWFFELLHELPRIRRHAVEKPALSLGKQDVERDRRFAGAAQAGDDHELFPRDFQIDVFKVVLSRALNMNCAVAFVGGPRAFGRAAIYAVIAERHRRSSSYASGIPFRPRRLRRWMAGEAPALPRTCEEIFRCASSRLA